MFVYPVQLVILFASLIYLIGVLRCSRDYFTCTTAVCLSRESIGSCHSTRYLPYLRLWNQTEVNVAEISFDNMDDSMKFCFKMRYTPSTKECESVQLTFLCVYNQSVVIPTCICGIRRKGRLKQKIGISKALRSRGARSRQQKVPHSACAVPCISLYHLSLLHNFDRSNNSDTWGLERRISLIINVLLWINYR